MSSNIVRRVSNLERRVVVRRAPRPEPVPLDRPADVLAVLAEQVAAVRADPLTPADERARTLGLLAGVALRAMEARDVDERLAAVEHVLKLRRDADAAQRPTNKRR